MIVSDVARFGPTLSSKSVAPLIDVMVSGNCRPGVEPSLLDAAGGVVDVTLTVRPVCAGFQEQLTFVPQTQLPVPLVAPGSLSVVWIWMVVTSFINSLNVRLNASPTSPKVIAPTLAVTCASVMLGGVTTGVTVWLMTVSDRFRFGATPSSLSSTPVVLVIVSGSCNPGVEPPNDPNSPGWFTVTVSRVRALSHVQLTPPLPQTQVNRSLFRPGSLSRVWICGPTVLLIICSSKARVNASPGSPKLLPPRLTVTWASVITGGVAGASAANAAVWGDSALLPDTSLMRSLAVALS